MHSFVSHIKEFSLTVFVGALAPSFLPTIITTILAATMFSGDGPDEVTGLVGVAQLALSPFLIALAIVLPASLLIGLPLTALFSRLRRESAGAYIWAGVITGSVLPPVILLQMNSAAGVGWLMTLLGAFSGGITGRTWWTVARQKVVEG